MQTFLKVVVGLLIAGILATVIVLATGPLTSKEAGLLSIILFVCSVAVTWVVAHVYGESAHRRAIEEVKELHKENLRTYAHKAAEKVNNLSNQLNMLSVYLQQELDATDYGSSDEELLVNEERMAAAIQITNMLKSINDTALSDWQGVIGEELDQQRKQKEEREEDIRKLLQRFESIWESERASHLNKQEDAGAIRSEIVSLREQIKALLTTVVGGSIAVPRKPKSSRHMVEGKCPTCGAELSYRQRARVGIPKGLTCAACKSKLMSRYDEVEGFVLEPRRLTAEDCLCPKCGTHTSVALDPLIGSSTNAECKTCKIQFHVARAKAGVRVSLPPLPESFELSEDIIDSVQKALPEQPWPKHTSKNVAATLGLPHEVVHKAVQELIRRGVFKAQIDGQLYEPVSPDGSNAGQHKQ